MPPSRGGGSELDLCLGVPDDLVAGLLSDGVHDRTAVLHLAHKAGHDDLLLRYAHPAELHGKALEVSWSACRLGLRPRDLGHAPQAVEDPPWQPDGFRELLVDANRVEVAEAPA